MVALTRDGTRAYTSNAHAGTVSAIDLQAKEVLAVIPVAKFAQRIALSVDDRWAFTADQEEPRLAVIDTATNRVERWVDLPGVAYGTAPTPDGRFLVMALPGVSQVALLDLESMEVVKTLDVPKSPQFVLVRPDGLVAYVSCDRSGKVAEIDLGEWRVARLIDAGPLADGLAWVATAGGTGAVAQEPSRPMLTDEEAERFLLTAEVVSRRALDVGITHADQLTLSDGLRTARAVWKTIDELNHGVTRLERGRVLVGFADSWKHEVAAYELDKLLGTGLVPPTVERTLGRTTGSAQMWVEGSMTEADRKAKRIAPPDTRAWNEQMHTVRLLHQLTDNTDYRNIRNVLVDPSFRIYAVDFSRAFTIYGELRSP